MQKASLDHVNDHGPKNLTGHKGSDGSKPFERLGRYGHCPGFSGENLAYGDFEPIHIVLQMMIDDGLKSRPNRTNLMNPSFRRFSAANGTHVTFKKMIVCNYAEFYAKQEE